MNSSKGNWDVVGYLDYNKIWWGSIGLYLTATNSFSVHNTHPRCYKSLYRHMAIWSSPFITLYFQGLNYHQGAQSSWFPVTRKQTFACVSELRKKKEWNKVNVSHASVSHFLPIHLHTHDSSAAMTQSASRPDAPPTPPSPSTSGGESSWPPAGIAPHRQKCIHYID